MPPSLLGSVNEVIEWTPDVAFGPKRTCRKTQSMSLLGAKRTWLLRRRMSAFDPKRTSTRAVQGHLALGRSAMLDDPAIATNDRADAMPTCLRSAKTALLFE